MSIVIDKQFLERVVPQILDEFGTDYVYPGSNGFGTCQYVKDDKPSCLVGQVMHRAGVPLEALALMDARPILDADGLTEGTNAMDLPRFLKHLCGVEVEWNHLVGMALETAQHWQDTGGTWGEAWVRAQEVL